MSTDCKGLLDKIGTYRLERREHDPRPIVVMTCGISGAGKSTLSQAILELYPAFTRLSIDAYVYAHHGRCSVDFPVSLLEQYQDEAEKALKGELRKLISNHQDVILDLSLAFREDRELWKKIVEEEGGRWVIVFLDASPEVLRRRVKERNRRIREDNSGAVEVAEETLEQYLVGFERPDGEGEVSIRID